MFGIAEQPMLEAARSREVETKLELVRALIARRGAKAAALATTDHVAWLSGGMTNRIEPGSAASPLWLVVTADAAFAVTTNVEAPRLAAESGLSELGFELHEADWFAPDRLDTVARELAGVARFPDLDDELVAARLALLEPERGRLAELAADAAAALEDSLRQWTPGELDFDIQGRVAERLERVGAFGACLIVGGDERVERFRHPLARGARVGRLVMAVAVAERHGLHAAATRFASAGPLAAEVRRSREAALAVERAVLGASTAGSSYADVVAALARAYGEAGHPDAWREHYQGGPIGYRQREFEPAPGTRLALADTVIAPGHAVAWNPSIAGGGKCEDTYLVEASGLRRLTSGDGWPLEDDGRPAVLDIVDGGAA
jgi:Xaa-Pro dipeptidase